MAGKPFEKDRHGDFWWADTRRLIEEDGFNRREDYGDLEQLATEIDAQGLDVLPPLTVYKKGEFWVVVRGHRRCRAIKILEKRHKGEILWVRILPERKGYSKEKRLLDQITENEGKRFTPWEQAKVFRDLRGMGWSEEDMVKRSGRSEVYIRRLLSLADAPQKLINLVRGGTVSGTLAMDMIADKKVEELIERAEKGEFKNLSQNADLFGEQPPPKPEKITKSDVRPNSVKIFKKWAPKVEREKIPEEKLDFFDFIQRLLKGELEEKDFKKFFK